MQKPLKEGEDYVVLNDGRLVFTEHYLKKRGYCCGNGCRHCPYNFDNVPEPKKRMLLDERKKIDG